jgi:2'-5' RNA ligase
MLRLFVALPLPETVRENLAGIAGGLPGARWVDPDRLHLTLRFIGEVDGAMADDIADSLHAIRMPELELQLRGLGTFGDKRGATTLWAGVRPNEGLVRLRNKVEHALTRIGLEPERRKFHPHITLARLAGDAPLLRFLQLRGDYLGEPFRVHEFILYSSFLGHGSGALYREEAVFPLGDRVRAESMWLATAGAEE